MCIRDSDGSFASSLEEFAQLVTDRYNERYDYENCTFDIRHNISGNILYSLPFKGNRLVEGWQISSIVGIHTGLPLNVYNSGIQFSDPADLDVYKRQVSMFDFPRCSILRDPRARPS